MEKSKIVRMIALVAVPLFIVFLLAGFWIGRHGSLLLAETASRPAASRGS